MRIAADWNRVKDSMRGCVHDCNAVACLVDDKDPSRRLRKKAARNQKQDWNQFHAISFRQFSRC
jgi:hypothetical protein